MLQQSRSVRLVVLGNRVTGNRLTVQHLVERLLRSRFLDLFLEFFGSLHRLLSCVLHFQRLLDDLLDRLSSSVLGRDEIARAITVDLFDLKMTAADRGAVGRDDVEPLGDRQGFVFTRRCHEHVVSRVPVDVLEGHFSGPLDRIERGKMLGDLFEHHVVEVLVAGSHRPRGVPDVGRRSLETVRRRLGRNQRLWQIDRGRIAPKDLVHERYWCRIGKSTGRSIDLVFGGQVREEVGVFGVFGGI